MTSADFERWRPRVIAGLSVAACLIVAYWVAWWTDRSLVASRTTSAYYSFEDGFPLADGWLVFTIVAAVVQLARRRPSALLWLLVGAGAGMYLLFMDTLYDVGHGIYGSGFNGVIELIIDILVAGTSISVLCWSWQARDQLLEASPAIRGRRSPAGRA